MKPIAIMTAGLLSLLTVVRADPKPAEPPLSYADLDARPVIGRLGKPLGETFEVEAVIRSGSEKGRSKADYGRYLLDVTSVDGKVLDKPETMQFWTAPSCGSDLDGNTTSRAERLNPTGDEKTAPKDLDRNYVGRHVKLCVWETGGFDGAPRHFPHDVAPTWQDRSFGFRTCLAVLIDRTAKP